MSVYEKVSALSIAIPELTPPVAACVLFVRTGNHVFLSGHIAKRDGPPCSGEPGIDVTSELGKAAARAVTIDLIGTLNAGVDDLDRIRRIVKPMVLVNNSPTYIEKRLVANGASEFLKEVFGERGARARSAFECGANSI